MLSRPKIRNGHVEVIRWSIGVNPIVQTNDAAPCKKGWWAFFKGLDCIGISGGSVDAIVGRVTVDTPEDERQAIWDKRERLMKLLLKGHTMLLPADAHIYCGWLPNGTVTRSGFFNSGDWQFLSVHDALTGAERAVAKAAGTALRNGYGSPENYLDTADFQIFIPHTVRLKGRSK